MAERNVREREKTKSRGGFRETSVQARGREGKRARARARAPARDGKRKRERVRERARER